jgi:hypothetical protein
MIRDDNELHAAQERLLLFERLLAEARKTYSAANYQAMAGGYLKEIEQMHGEIREYLSKAADPTPAA